MCIIHGSRGEGRSVGRWTFDVTHPPTCLQSPGDRNNNNNNKKEERRRGRIFSKLKKRITEKKHIYMYIFVSVNRTVIVPCFSFIDKFFHELICDFNSKPSPSSSSRNSTDFLQQFDVEKSTSEQLCRPHHQVRTDWGHSSSNTSRDLINSRLFRFSTSCSFFPSRPLSIAVSFQSTPRRVLRRDGAVRRKWRH